MKRKIRILSALMTIVMIALCFLATQAKAEDSITIDVLIPKGNNYGYCYEKNGKYAGYYIDYLKEIAKYTGWKYNYIIAEDNEELIEHMEKGDYDIMPGIVYSEKLRNITIKYGVPTDLLQIEITETMAVSDFNSLIRVAKELKMLGFSIAIDDFGSGYSTIQLLYKLPIDVVKFDRNFLIKKENPIEDDIMNELVTICHKNGIIVVCEGIETTENEECNRMV